MLFLFCDLSLRVKVVGTLFDQPGALIVRDQPDGTPALVQMMCEPSDGGRLSGAEETADHDVAGARFGHDDSPSMRSMVVSR